MAGLPPFLKEIRVVFFGGGARGGVGGGPFYYI